MNVILKERLLAVKLARQAAGIDAARRAELLSLDGRPVPTRRQAKRMKKSFRAINRHRQRESVMNMGNVPGLRPIVPMGKDTKKLFAAHERRKEAGWIRG